MEFIIPLLAVVALIGIFGSRMFKHNSESENQTSSDDGHDEAAVSIDEAIRQTAEESNQKNEKNMNDEEKPDTSGIMFKILTDLGCQPEKNEDGSVSVKYQGENFHIEFNARYVRIWDLYWSVIKPDDPNLPQLREAINDANFCFGPTVIISDPNDDGLMGIHSRWDIMLHPDVHDNDLYIQSVLGAFFKIKETVRDQFHQINIKQTEQKKTQRPIGFVSAAEQN